MLKIYHDYHIERSDITTEKGEAVKRRKESQLCRREQWHSVLIVTKEGKVKRRKQERNGFANVDFSPVASVPLHIYQEMHF